MWFSNIIYSAPPEGMKAGAYDPAPMGISTNLLIFSLILTEECRPIHLLELHSAIMSYSKVQ
jgi:hypothetical protein